MSDTTRELFAAQDGDPRAFERFVQLTLADVSRFCHYISDPGTGEDLVQETYLRVLRSLDTFRGDADGTKWLLAIARRAWADTIERNQRARRTEITRRVPSDHAATTELEALLDDLPDDRRDAFVLTQLLGYRYDEAAAICDCAVGTIRSRVARARAQLAATVRSADQPAG